MRAWRDMENDWAFDVSFHPPGHVGGVVNNTRGPQVSSFRVRSMLEDYICG